MRQDESSAIPLATGVVLRPYSGDADRQAIAALVAEIWSGGGPALMEQRYGPIGGRPWTYWMSRNVLDDLGAADCRAFVAEASGGIVGFCSYTVDLERRRGTVGYNGVARSHQGKGLGSAMLAFVLERMKAEGMTFAAVIVADNEAHAPAQAMYHRAGFEILSSFHYMVQKF